PGSYLFRGAVAQPTTPARRCLPSFRADPHQRTGNQTRTSAIRGTRTPRSPVAATGTFALLERKDAFPVVLHADDGPALLLCFVVEGLRESADLGVAQALRRAVGVFAPLIVVQHQHHQFRSIAGTRVLEHLLVARRVAERRIRPAADHQVNAFGLAGVVFGQPG